jgi:hypothetical protein
MFNRLFKSEHKRVAEMLSAYLDGELSPKEQSRVEKHLAQCADCAQNLRTLRQTVALLGHLPPVAVPRSFAIRPQVARRPSFFQPRRTYVYLRAATALATVLFAVVLAGDVFLTGLAPSLAPARVPEVVEREVLVEKAVAETVVVEKEVVVEARTEAPVVESESAYAATPSPAPAEDKEEWEGAPKPLSIQGAGAKGMEATGTPPAVEQEAPSEAPPGPGEERFGANAIPTPLPAEVIATAGPSVAPTAVAEVLSPTPFPQEPVVPPATRRDRLEWVQWRVVEAGLLSLVLVLAIATLVAKRRQNIGWR